MKSIQWTILAAALALAGTDAMAVTYNAASYAGSRSVNGGGIIANPNWSYEAVNATLLWDIQYDWAQSRWNYNYTWRISDAGSEDKQLSHIIFEVSSGYGLPAGTYSGTGSTGSNPGMPGSIYGIKYDATGLTHQTTIGADTYLDVDISFTSTHGPMWGDFYAKDGTYSEGQGKDQVKYDVYAYNTGYGTDLSDVHAGLYDDTFISATDANKYVLVPNSIGVPDEHFNPYPNPTPDAGTTVSLIGLALLGIEGLRRRLS